MEWLYLVLPLFVEQYFNITSPVTIASSAMFVYVDDVFGVIRPVHHDRRRMWWSAAPENNCQNTSTVVMRTFMTRLTLLSNSSEVRFSQSTWLHAKLLLVGFDKISADTIDTFGLNLHRLSESFVTFV